MFLFAKQIDKETDQKKERKGPAGQVQHASYKLKKPTRYEWWAEVAAHIDASTHVRPKNQTVLGFYFSCSLLSPLYKYKASPFLPFIFFL